MINLSPSGPSLANVAPLPAVYYDPSTGRYFLKNKHGEWMNVNAITAESYVVSQGYSRAVSKTNQQSEAERVMLRIQLEKCVHYAGPLAGYKVGPHLIGATRVLVTKAVLPVTPGPGSWPTLGTLLTQMFGAVQLDFLYGWLKQTLAMLRSGKHRPGQALGICGPTNAGKSLFGSVLTTMFGGEPGQPWRYMNGKTEFNSDLFASVLLLIDDAAESTDHRMRRAFAAHIKQIVAVRTQPCHKKHAEQLSLRPLWRLVILLNDDPERLMVLPPLDADIEDKLMLFKVEGGKMPMPTNTPEEAEALMDTLVAELPAFVHFLDGWTVPPRLVHPRYGIERYHHPEVARDIGATTPEEQLKEMIDEVIFGTVKGLLNHPNPWEGNAAKLLHVLTGKDSECAREAEKLLAGGRAVCGKYLARLAKDEPGRFGQCKADGLTVWTIQPPPRVISADDAQLRADLEARIRAKAATKEEQADTSTALRDQKLSV